MKYGPVVPQIDDPRKMQFPHILFKPYHAVGPWPQAGTCDTKRRLRQIDHRQVLESAVEQFVDQCGGSSPNVYDLTVVFERNCVDQLKSGGGFRFKPAHLIRTLAGPYAFPMLSVSHMHLLTPQPLNSINRRAKGPFNLALALSETSGLTRTPS